MLVTRFRAFAAAFIVVLAVGLGVAGVVATAMARTPAAHHKRANKAHRKAATHKRARRHRKRRKHVKRTHAALASAAKKKRGGGGGTGGTGGTGHAGTGSNPPSIYWGASIGSQLTGSQAPWDMSAVSDVAAESGKGFSLVHFGTPFASCGSITTSSCSTSRSRQLRSPTSAPTARSRSSAGPRRCSRRAQPAELPALRHDRRQVRHLHPKVRRREGLGHPFFLRFDWEMNASEFPWSRASNGENPADYVAAWRHVHDMFARAGATECDVGVVPERRSRTGPGHARRALPRATPTWTGPASTATTATTRGGPWRASSEPTTN